MALQAPTFAGTVLCTTSYRQVPGPVGVRAFLEHIPGVNGQYAQPQGNSGRDIAVTGILHTTAKESRILALTAAYAELRAKEDLANGTTVGDYVDPAAKTISNCMLMQYAPSGSIEIVPTSTNFKGIIPIRAIIRELSP